MAHRMIQIACDRFRNEISLDDARVIEATTSLDDVRLAIRQVERQLAARQLLRDMDRITPFIDAIDRYSKALEAAANGTPYLPWIWAPIKFVLLAVQDHTHALDKILSAYGKIGLQMPRFSRFAEAFPDDRSFQHLLGFLFEDVLEFHRRAYAMIRKPGWKMFFRSAWGGFDHRFGSLLESISRVSDQIDREAVSIDLVQAADQRKKEEDAATEREARWRTQQLCIVLNWLEASDTDQESKFEFLRDRCHEGTLDWVTSSPKLRGWLQRGHGKQVLWLYGKPGSGKSVLTAKLISFLRADSTRRVAFFFCDFNTPVHAASAGIFRSLAAQILRFSPDAAPFVYGEYIANGKKPTNDSLKKLLPQLIANKSDVRLVIDGLDEISTSEHRKLITDLLRVTKDAPECKMLLISQDVPSISVQLSKHTRLSMAEEDDNTRKDLTVVVREFLKDLDSQHDGALGEAVLQGLQDDILQKAEGMFLWVHLVLDILINSACLEDLRLQISSLPATLAEAYSKILNNICSRCSTLDVARIRRVFAWLRYQKGRVPLRKHQLRIGASLFPGREALNNETKPLPNMTDICKPLIEDGPGGCLVFVHSTVPQFLEEHETPFIDRLESQASIAYACVCQLNQGLDLLVPSSTPLRVTEIALGLLSLWPYSLEHWIEHLLDCFEIERNAMPECILTLVERVNLICHRMMMMMPDTRQALGHSASLANSGKDKRLSNLVARIDPSVTHLMEDLCKVSAATNDDQSPLARAMRAYQHAVEFLLRENDVNGISTETIFAFRELHGPIAFLCNIRGCEHAIIGFPSREKLKDHQDLHFRELKCYERNCSYNDIGFQTESSLRRHRKQYHEAARLEQVPKRLRRMSRPSQDAESQHHSDEDDWDYIVNPKVPRKLTINSCHFIQGTSVLWCTNFSPDGKRIAIVGNKTLSIYEAHTGIMLHEFASEAELKDVNFREVCFSPDGNYLVACGEETPIWICYIELGEYQEFCSHELDVYSLCFVPDGETLVSGDGNGELRFWNVRTESTIASLDLPKGITNVAASSDCKHVAAGCFDNNCHIFHVETKSLLTVLRGHKDIINSVAFSPDDKHIATASDDRTIKIWRPDHSPQCLRTLEGHEDCVLSATFTADARWFISSSNDNNVRMWDIQTGEHQVILKGHRESVMSVAASPKGNYIASASEDMRLGIWSYQEL